MPYDRAECDRLWQTAKDWHGRNGRATELVEHILTNNYSVDALADFIGRAWQEDPFGTETPRRIASELLQVRLAREQTAAAERIDKAATRLSVASIVLAGVSLLVAVLELFGK